MNERPNLIPCPDCGQTCSRNAEACPHCGRYFQRFATSDVTVSREGWISTIAWGIILAVVIPWLILLGIVIFFAVVGGLIK